MQSILLASENRKRAKEYIDKISRIEKVEPIDVGIHSFEKAVGIEEVRNIRKKIFLKPLRGKTKIAVIEAYEGITIESQNAFLKILEEPPNNTIIIITVARIGLILPTILSRCKIIELKQEIQALSKQELLSTKDILVYLQSKEIGGKLKLAQDLTKNKDEVIPWIEKMIIVAREEMIINANNKPNSLLISQYLNILISLNKTHTILKTTNVNPRLTLENLFLNI